MDIAAMTRAMKDSISEVLEQMFFLPVEFIDLQQTPAFRSADPGTLLTAMVGFDGPLSGNFRLWVPRTLATEAAADFMGVLPEALDEDQVAGTVLEMINMLAGNTLGAYAPRTIFDLRIPEMAPRPDRSGGEDRPVIEIGIQTPGGHMAFHLLCNGAPEKSSAPASAPANRRP